MYNLTHLNTFVRVAELGSFRKVAEEQFLSVNAIMKQINNLESELDGIKLFERTPRGITLTSVGEDLYTEAKEIINLCDESRSRIINNGKAYSNTIRIAMPDTYLSSRIDTILESVHLLCPELYIELVEQDKSMKESLLNWKSFSKWTDIALETYTEDDFKSSNYSGLTAVEACALPLYCLCSKGSELAEKERITLKDFNSYKVHILHDDVATVLKRLNSSIAEAAPEAILKTHAFFTNSLYNDIANNRSEVLIDISGYKRVHPLIKAIPVEFEPLKYGFIFEEHASKKVQRFIDCLKIAIRIKNEDLFIDDVQK